MIHDVDTTKYLSKMGRVATITVTVVLAIALSACTSSAPQQTADAIDPNDTPVATTTFTPPVMVSPTPTPTPTPNDREIAVYPIAGFKPTMTQYGVEMIEGATVLSCTTNSGLEVPLNLTGTIRQSEQTITVAETIDTPDNSSIFYVSFAPYNAYSNVGFVNGITPFLIPEEARGFNGSTKLSLADGDFGGDITSITLCGGGA